MSDQGQIERDTERYLRAAHRVQTALAFRADDPMMTPKHLRVGIDMSKSDMAGLATLLIGKGIFTREEYVSAIADAAEKEAAAGEDDLSILLGKNVRTL